MKTVKKQAILKSLESMNSTEMDKVIDYIKDLLYNDANDLKYQEFKQKAMSEIREALEKGDVSVTA